MAQHYSNPERANEFGALPDVETFSVRTAPCWYCSTPMIEWEVGCILYCSRCGRESYSTAARWTVDQWYWQPCFPGCMPDGDPNGPFATEAEALDDAREGVTDGDSNSKEEL